MKKIVVIILLLTCISAICYKYMYKVHRDIKSETANYNLSIANLESEFAKNQSVAMAKYQDKIIQISDTINALDIKNKSMTFAKKIAAIFDTDLPNDFAIGKKVTIKGRFLGYDELLDEYKIDQCSVVN